MGRKLSLLESMELKKGDTFELGVWKNRIIKWLVLKSSENGILCISRFCLDRRKFDSKSNIWKTSELRQWLNSDFLNNAFNSEERSFILPYEGDKVTLLNVEEVDKYLPSNFEGKATNANEDSGWWLRSRDFRSNDEAYAYINGNIFSLYVAYASGAVYPVILLKKDIENFLEPEV